MKLYAHHQVYLQSYDLAHMIVQRGGIPDFLLKEIEQQLPPGSTHIDLTDQFNFAWRFQTLQSIEWLMDCDYIVDYEEFRNDPPEILDEMAGGYLQDWFNLMIGAEYSDDVTDEEMEILHDLGQVIYSLQALSEYKKGNLRFPNLPDEYRYQHHNPLVYSRGFPIGRLHRRLDRRTLREL